MRHSLMQIFRLILPQYAFQPGLKHTVEGPLSEEEYLHYNSLGYNCYFFPNSPSEFHGSSVISSDIDNFDYCFIDLDMKDYKSKDLDRTHNYETKDQVIEQLRTSQIPPTTIIDSGGGIHAYWKLTDLEVKSYLRLQRRLSRHFHSDPEVSKIAQLMRVPGTVNTKLEDNLRICEVVEYTDRTYSCEELNKHLPPITNSDETYCNNHYDRMLNPDSQSLKISDKMPDKFGKLLRENKEVSEIWKGNTDDRSKTDWRLGHILQASGFTKEEATSVLVNSQKALERAPMHRISYALGIVEKIFTYEESTDKDSLDLSKSVRDILCQNPEQLRNKRLVCHSYIDGTDYGFRLGQVVGLVAGSGVGKSSLALNMFLGFVQNNPEYDHFFIPLEEGVNAIAEKWKLLCGDNVALHSKVHLLGNYNDDDSYRHLSLSEIRDYLLKFQQTTGKKIGSVVIDHVGVLNKKTDNGENQGLIDIFHQMKAFAMQTETLLIMQSQSSREKAGIGDLELNKDAAFGSVFFEAYCDFVITMHQPLKRCYDNPACPTVTSFKFAKIRNKNKTKDFIQEDVCYKMFYEPEKGSLRELTQVEEKQFTYFLALATNKRKLDRKTDIVPYKSITWTKEIQNA
jgi:hypothetical protein